MAIANHSSIPNGVSPKTTTIDAVLDKYHQERDKRLRSDGTGQYTDLDSSDKFKHLGADPWTHDVGDMQKAPIQDGGRYEFLILGAGFTALLNAARLQGAGVSPDDIRLVDSAGGFGGTWYWNRYPGLMCDVESYIYLPLLEEMGYMPKHKYSYGPELRRYAEMVAERYHLTDKALFGFRVTSMSWDDTTKDWKINAESATGVEKKESITFRSRFIISSAGLLNWPKIPNIPGLETFTGHVFHTSRWDYDYTGGSPEDPKLEKLAGKSVAILGTGATAIQVVPELAKYAKHLYVIQRTPSAVDRRDQCETDVDWWRTQTKSKGWQAARRSNFNSFISDVPEKVDLVHDGWTSLQAYATLAGTPKNIPLEKVQEHVDYLNNLDIPRSERVRARVDQIVKDPETADKLKAWYPGWCKRPCFHDEYLKTFNEPNVTLIDTNGRGLDSLTEQKFVFGGKEYPIDLLVLSTGYQPPLGNTPAGYAHATVKGRDGLTLEEAWKEGPKTFHGMTVHGFPNYFFYQLTHTGLSPNYTNTMDVVSSHVAYIIAKASNQVKDHPSSGDADSKYPFIIEPTATAQEAWTTKVVELSTAGAGMAGCTPGYFNHESEIDKMSQKGPKEQLKLARSAVWGRGLEDYQGFLETWRKEGKLDGLVIITV